MDHADELSTAIAMFVYSSESAPKPPIRCTRTPARYVFSFRISFGANKGLPRFYDKEHNEIAAEPQINANIARHGGDHTSVIDEAEAPVVEFGMDVAPSLVKCRFAEGEMSPWKVEQCSAFFWLRLGESCGASDIAIECIQNPQPCIAVPVFTDLPLGTECSFNPSIAKRGDRLWCTLRHMKRCTSTTSIHELAIGTSSSSGGGAATSGGGSAGGGGGSGGGVVGGVGGVGCDDEHTVLKFRGVLSPKRMLLPYIPRYWDPKLRRCVCTHSAATAACKPPLLSQVHRCW
jgi:hypothetical protein